MKFSGRLIDGNVAGGQLAVRFKSQHILDTGTVMNIMAEVQEAMQKYRVHTVILNFAAVKQMSSQMLGKVLQIRKTLDASKGTLGVCCLSGDALEAFKLCGFHKLIKVHKSEEKALADV